MYKYLLFIIFSRVVIFGYSFGEYYFSQNKTASQYYLFSNASITNAKFDYLIGKERKINFKPPINVEFQTTFTLSNKLNNTYEFGYFDTSQMYLYINSGFVYALDYLDGNKDDTSRYNSIKVNGYLYGVNGIYLKKIFDNYFIKLNYINGKEFNQVSFTGFLQEGANERYIINSKHHYSYKNYITHDIVKPKDIFGTGYGMDIGYFNTYKNIKYIFQIENLGYIIWKNIPYYSAITDNQVIYLGDDGYNHYKPLIKARYSTTKRKYFKLIPYYIFALKRDDFSFVWKNIQDINYYFISNQISQDIKLGYFINSKDLSISYAIKKSFSFTSTISVFKPNQYRGINISLRYQF